MTKSNLDFDSIKEELYTIIENNGGNKLHLKMAELFIDCIKVSVAKNKDYADNSDPYKNFRLAENMKLCSIETAIQVRRCDKFTRECNLIFNDNSVKDESIFDTLLDDIVYTAILYAYLDEKYKNINNKLENIKNIVRDIISKYYDMIEGWNVVYNKNNNKFEVLILYNQNFTYDIDIEKEIIDICKENNYDIEIINHISER